jgi:hypothetical protein
MPVGRIKARHGPKMDSEEVPNAKFRDDERKSLLSYFFRSKKICSADDKNDNAYSSPNILFVITEIATNLQC